MAFRASFVPVVLFAFSAVAAHPQQAKSPDGVSVVQPGAPGETNKKLSNPATTLPPSSDADVKFMQGMVMHHGQAVEMTELLRTRSHDPEVQALGKRISISQTDEMAFMKRWLKDRGKSTEMEMDMSHMDHSHMDMKDMNMDMPPMPGMLTQAQMKALAAADGPAFDHLFLTGMIQHHTGALTMVQDLFAAPAAGQDPQLFDFANDVDNTQLAEIDIMKALLKKEKQ